MRSRAVWCAPVFVALGLTPLAQIGAATPQAGAQGPTSFQARANAVRLDVRVVDAQGHFVHGLTRENFTVVDDGVTQDIAQCVVVDLPRPASTPRSDLRADAASNRGAGEGRLYAIVFDDLHINAGRLVTARQIARQFIERYLSDNDLVAIGTTSGNVWVAHEFSSNRASLLDAVEQLGTASGDESRSLGGLSAFIGFLATIPERRKSVLLISEGLGLDAYTSAAARDLRTVIDASAIANVSIYPIDPRGDPGNPFTIIKPAPTDRDRLAGYERGERRNLVRLAEATGGMALVGSNLFTDSFERIVSDGSAYYLLGYAPTPTNNKRRHEIHITVNRPELTVMSSRAYVRATAAQSQGTSSVTIEKALREILESAVPRTGLSMEVTAAAFFGAGSKNPVAVIVEASDNSPGAIDIAVSALAASGTAKGFEKSAIDLLPAKGEERHSRGRFMTTLTLPPGRYHLRAAAIRRDTSTSASVLHEFWVPDFRQASLILSDVMLSAETPDSNEAAGSQARPPRPLARRTFAPGETLTVSGELYGRDSKVERVLALRGFISSADGGVVRESASGLVRVAAGDSRSPFAATFSLGDLPAGAYVVDVELKTAGGIRQDTVTRRVPFTVY